MVINSIYEFTPPPISLPYRGRVKYPLSKNMSLLLFYYFNTTKLHKNSLPPNKIQKFSIHPHPSIATLVSLSIF